MNVISREDAVIKELKRYFSGEACRHGHISERYTNNGVCVDCMSAYLQTWRVEDPERCTRYRKRHPILALLANVKSKCKRYNIPFDLEFDDISVPDNCPVLGIPLDRRDRNHSPSLDRFNPSNGYVKKNVNVISLKANRLKNNGTLEDFERIVDYMKKYQI